MKTFWFIFCGSELLLQKSSDGYTILFADVPPISAPTKATVHNITPFENGEQVKTFALDEKTDVDGFEWCPLRPSFYKITRPLYDKAGKCYEILFWDAHTKYCGICGAPMKMSTDISKVCTKCGNEIWPQLATAVIVLISKGDEILLVHANNFKSNFYGLVAGFVETGETLEEAVAREVLEETGLKIKNLSYFASQPWPYPCGLMVGFFAEYESGEIHLQLSELQKGGWFHKDHLPQIPEKLSIARRLIDTWLDMKNRA